MAGEWIKMRLDLASDPGVNRIRKATGNACSTHAMLRNAARILADKTRMEEANGTASN